jgi:hypothetical protein
MGFWQRLSHGVKPEALRPIARLTGYLFPLVCP